MMSTDKRMSVIIERKLIFKLCGLTALLVFFFSSLSSTLRTKGINYHPIQINSDNTHDMMLKVRINTDKHHLGVKEMVPNKRTSELGIQTSTLPSSGLGIQVPALTSPGTTQTVHQISSRNFDLDLTWGVTAADTTSQAAILNSEHPRDSNNLHPMKASSTDVSEDAPLTTYEAVDQFWEMTLPSCENRCNDQILGCDITHKTGWNALNNANQLPYRPFLTTGHYVFSWERVYMRRPTLTDLRTLPSLRLSKVTVESVEGRGMVRCQINDVIHGRVDMVDGYGRLRSNGDDEVRVWITSGQLRGNSSTGDVTDLKNGSYSFAIRCLWPGNSTLNVALAYPREFIRIAIHQTRIGVTRFVGVLFKKNKTLEHTLCLGTPNVPGRACVCNMSKDGRAPFYCGRPVQPGLTCDDWVYTYYLDKIPVSHNVSEAETLLVNQSAGEVDTLTSDWTRQCLTNTSVHLFGDSNVVIMYNTLSDLTKCTNLTGDPTKRCWCFLHETNMNLSFTQHEFPKYFSSERSLTTASVASAIDAIPSTGRHVIIVHYYLHYTAGHLMVVHQRLKAVRDAMARLLKRNKEIYIGIRGPHISYQGWTQNQAIGGDPMGMMLNEIIQNIFQGLEDKVVFLDGWDMSISLENFGFHPPSFFSHAMIKTFLSYFCS